MARRVQAGRWRGGGGEVAGFMTLGKKKQEKKLQERETFCVVRNVVRGDMHIVLELVL